LPACRKCGDTPRARVGPEVCVDVPCEGVKVHREGTPLDDGVLLRKWDRYLLCLVPRTAEAKMTELDGHELQAPEVDSLVRMEGGDVPELTNATGGEHQARIDAEGRHRAITWW
jgi:hypothetical protein